MTDKDRKDEWRVLEKGLIGITLGIFLFLKSLQNGIFYAIGYCAPIAALLIMVFLITRKMSRIISIGTLILLIVASFYYLTHPNLLKFGL